MANDINFRSEIAKTELIQIISAKGINLASMSKRKISHL